MFRTTDGSPWLRYGQTPVVLQRRDFDRLADYLGTTVEEAAESVLGMSPLERAELLQRFYTSVGLSGAEDAYEVIKGEIKDEERELRAARDRLREDLREEEGEASDKTTVIAKRKFKKIPHQSEQIPLESGSDSVDPTIVEPVPIETQDDNRGVDDENTSSASLSLLKPPPAESYSRKRSSISSSCRPKGAGSFKSRGLTGEAYYDSILNPKSIKLDEDVESQDDATAEEYESDTEIDDQRAYRRMKPAPEEEYQSRSQKIPTERQSRNRRGISSLMEKYEKLLN